jgi:chromosome partitioning protein
MGGNTSPRTIATINFKEGVEKTTVTWCLGEVVSSFSDARVLMFDLDAQMSLTQAIALNEATGALWGITAPTLPKPQTTVGEV